MFSCNLRLLLPFSSYSYPQAIFCFLDSCPASSHERLRCGSFSVHFRRSTVASFFGSSSSDLVFAPLPRLPSKTPMLTCDAELCIRPRHLDRRLVFHQESYPSCRCAHALQAFLS